MKNTSKNILRTTLYALLPTILIAQVPDTLWTRTYGGVDFDVATSVIQLNDNGYIIGGYTESYGIGELDILIIRTNEVGDTIWRKTYGNLGDDHPFEIIKTIDSNYMIVATTWSWGSGDIWVLKINNDGDTLWTKRYGGQEDEWGRSIKQTYDGGYIITGTTCAFDPVGDIYVLKIDSIGDTLWSTIYDGGMIDEGYAIATCADSGYVIAGYSDIPYNHIYVMKLNMSADTVWTTTLNAGWAYVIHELINGGFVMACVGDGEVCLIRLDQQGDSLWCCKYGPGRAYDVVEIENDGFAAVGRDESGTSWDVTVIRTDDMGHMTWSRDYGGSSRDMGEALRRTSDGGYIIAGQTYSFGSGSSDFWLLKMSYDPAVQEQNNNTVRKEVLFTTIYAGPFQLPHDKPYKIFDVTGRQIHTLNPTPGIYFIQLDDKIVQKVIKIK